MVVILKLFDEEAEQFAKRVVSVLNDDWLLIDTIAMIGSPASRGAAPSVICSGRAWRGAA